MLTNVAMPNGIVMISPSATSPGLTTAEDNGLFFRTAPSDAREGEVAAEIMKERGITSIAITYTNNDYGKGLADAIQTSFEAIGGTVTISAAHEDGKADYSSEVAALASAGVSCRRVNSGFRRRAQVSRNQPAIPPKVCGLKASKPRRSRRWLIHWFL